MIKRLRLVLVLNFSTIAVGGALNGKGVPSNWYQNLDRAPWTPRGWALGSAWTLIMICFGAYIAYLSRENADQKEIVFFFVAQWILNVAWIPVFFYYQAVSTGFITISLLTILITYFLFHDKNELKLKSPWIGPYLIWLIISSSLNAYILLFN